MHEELIDIYDENMTFCGTAMKKVAHRQGLWHKSIHCWLFTTEGNEPYVIIQKRASTKLLMPNYYDVSIAGHYEAGEKRDDGFREVNEEYGIHITPDLWHYLGIKIDIGLSQNVINREFCEVYFTEINMNISDFHMSSSEVDAIVKIKASDGIALFSGEITNACAHGITWDAKRTKSVPFITQITVADFIPRIDSYYLKIFTIDDLYYKGYTHLYI